MKKIFRYLLLTCAFLMLVACGKPESQKAFENGFKEFKTLLSQKVENEADSTKAIAKIFDKATYKVNKVEEKGENSQLDVTIKAVNLSKYMNEYSEVIAPLVANGASDEELNQKAAEYFNELLKNEKDLEFNETNMQLQMQKINGEWEILNVNDLLVGIFGGSMELTQIGTQN